MLSAEDSARSTFFCPNCREERFVIPPPPNPNEAYCGQCGTRLSAARPAEYAGFWLRFAGWWIDYVVMSVIQVAIIAILVGALGDDGWTLGQVLGGLSVLVYIVVGNAEGGTVGKRAVGLKIIDDAGNKPGYGRAVIRLLVSFISSLVLLLGYILMVASPRKQTWHDAVAGTYVVRKPA